MARINKTQFALLGLLQMRGPSTGYEMKAFIDESLNYFWQENYGHIYPVLKKMEEKGLVTCREESNPGKPGRKVYTITERGAEELKQWRLSPVEPSLFKNEILLRIFFTPPEEKGKVIEMIELEAENHRRLLDEYARVEEHISKKHKGYSHILLTVKYGQKFSQAVLDWCLEAMEMLSREED